MDLLKKTESRGPSSTLLGCAGGGWEVLLGLKEILCLPRERAQGEEASQVPLPPCARKRAADHQYEGKREGKETEDTLLCSSKIVFSALMIHREPPVEGVCQVLRSPSDRIYVVSSMNEPSGRPEPWLREPGKAVTVDLGLTRLFNPSFGGALPRQAGGLSAFG